MPSPPVMVPETAARTWFDTMVEAGAGFTVEDFQETFRLLHGTRDVRTGAWRVGRSGMVSDPRTILEQRLHDAMGRRLARGSSGQASTGSTMFVPRQRIQGMEEALASHKGNPTGKLLRSPRGQLWELKLRHGARMRPADPPPSPP